MYVHIDYVRAEIAYRQERIARDFRRGGWFTRDRIPKADAPSIPALALLQTREGSGRGVDASRASVCVDDAA